jgi:hypothetical protein
MQQPWDQQVSICYLLGLDWSIPGKFQELRSREKVAQELRRAARGGDLGRFFGKAADLRTRLTVAEARAVRLRRQLVPEYKELERKANEITEKIYFLNVENAMDGDLLRQLRASFEQEDAPDLGDVSKFMLRPAWCHPTWCGGVSATWSAFIELLSRTAVHT